MGVEKSKFELVQYIEVVTRFLYIAVRYIRVHIEIVTFKSVHYIKILTGMRYIEVHILKFYYTLLT